MRSVRDLQAVQAILDAHGSPIKIISKIENQEGLDNIDEIIEASYGIMVARGDLGVELPAEVIPNTQRRIVEKCISAKRPVIIATQMLYSMVRNPRPTRAEVPHGRPGELSRNLVVDRNHVEVDHGLEMALVALDFAGDAGFATSFTPSVFWPFPTASCPSCASRSCATVTTS